MSAEEDQLRQGLDHARPVAESLVTSAVPPSSLSGTMALLLAYPPPMGCEHIGGPDWAGTWYIRLATPSVVLCWECCLQRENAWSDECARRHGAPVCCHCRSWAVSGGGIHLMRNDTGTVLGFVCELCAEQDQVTPGVITIAP